MKCNRIKNLRHEYDQLDAIQLLRLLLSARVPKHQLAGSTLIEGDQPNWVATLLNQTDLLPQQPPQHDDAAVATCQVLFRMQRDRTLGFLGLPVSFGQACRSATVISIHGFGRFSVYICRGRPCRFFGTFIE